MIDFSLTPEQKELQRAARQFANEVMTPIAGECDEHHRFPREVFAKAHELGLLNLAVPEELGGIGLDEVSQVLVAEELAAGCVGMATSMIANDLAFLPILIGATPEQKERFIKPFTERLAFVSFALTEPNAGSDVAGMKTTIKSDGDDYVINGSKMWITNGSHAEQLTLFGKTDPAAGHKGVTCVVVPGDAKGISRGKPERKMGQNASDTIGLTFEEVRVPKSNRIGAEGEGFKLAMKTLDCSRPLTAAFAIGIARKAMEHAASYSQERTAFGQPIAQFQAIQFIIAEMAMKLQAARLLVYQSAWMLEAGLRNTLISSYAKALAADFGMEIATNAVQVFGGYGYSKEYPVEKLMRDAKLIQIYEGTSQVQRMVVAREIFGGSNPSGGLV
ncbi:MAG: acyl-CoA dehydrogenase family protein [Deltaproteobacteria bacterium]|nr:acyl-CoA dehydrogenase family protein [Deltaproteobacteria bacterium]